MPPFLFWTAAGLAVAAAAGGVVYGILAINRRNEIDDLKNDDPFGGVGIVGPEDQEDVRNLARNADIFFGAALLFTTAAIIFAVFTEWGDPEEEGEASLSLSPAVGRDSAGLWLQGTF